MKEVFDEFVTSWSRAVGLFMGNWNQMIDAIPDAFGGLALRLLTYRCQHDRAYYRWRRCDCYVPVKEPARPVFLFYEDEKPAVPLPIKRKPANEYEAICLAVQEMQQAMADSMKAGFAFLENVQRHDSDEPPPYPEFFINH
jgi:hypothetical protein